MLPKKSRFSRKELALAKTIKRLHTPNFVVSVMKMPSQEAEGKVAVIVSKKVAQKANERNKLRRRVYSAVRENGLHKGFFTILAKPSSKNMQYDAILKELQAISP